MGTVKNTTSPSALSAAVQAARPKIAVYRRAGGNFVPGERRKGPFRQLLAAGFSRLAFAVSVIALLAATGCGDESNVVVDRLVPAYAQSLSVPGWSLAGEPLEVKIDDIALLSSCYSFERVDVTLNDRTYTFHPLAHHIERRGYGCLTAIAYVDTMVVVHPPDSGRYWFQVATLGDTVSDSTLVLDKGIAAASVDVLSIPPVCLFGDGIGVRLGGSAGDFSCYGLSKVGVTREDHNYILTPLARPFAQRDIRCDPGGTPFDTTFTLQPPEVGPYWIRVFAHNDTLVDSTKVK